MSILWFQNCSYQNVHVVGGKNASLGELFQLSSALNFAVANGFAITVEVYINFIQRNHLAARIKSLLEGLDITDTEKLNATACEIQLLISTGTFDEGDKNIILTEYQALRRNYDNVLQVAVRSSAIAEDLPNASFAGQQDTYLNIEEPDDLIRSIILCYASLFNARAISYRYTNNIEFSQVKMAVAIQKMVRSDLGSAGVAFSIDPESGYNKAIVINSAYGLGELVVSGGVRPDEIIIDKRSLEEKSEYPVIKKQLGQKASKIIYATSGGTEEVATSQQECASFSITDKQAINLAATVSKLEKSYQGLFQKTIGIDVEWALDGSDQLIYILQSRPETIHSNCAAHVVEKFVLKKKSNVLIQGISVGEKISRGRVKYLSDVSQYKLFNKGDILVTEMTTPDWEPIMKKSSGIITNKGGRTCHAAIVARELGVNAIVGTSNGTQVLTNDMEVTISCADGEVGKVYLGLLPFEIEVYDVNTDKEPPVKMMLNIGTPENAFSASCLPHSGVGLVRLEFIINNDIRIHPQALLDYPNVKPELRLKIADILKLETPREYFVKTLARGVGKIASAFFPEPVIVRLSDFKSNEYKNLLGGDTYEPDEENPMIGWRGASRYNSKEYRHAFDLECQALLFARNTMHMTNIIIMIPFCRTPDECQQVLDILSKNGLKRGENELEVYIMCEIPSNVIEADHFAPLIDGVSIGGNDLLQLTLGVDRDSEMVSHLSNHTNRSYRRMIAQAIHTYKTLGLKVGFCGQHPSDSTEFAEFLINEGIDSISVTPDSFLKTYKTLNQ